MQVGYLYEALQESDLPFRVSLLVWDEIPASYHRQMEAHYMDRVANLP